MIAVQPFGRHPSGREIGVSKSCSDVCGAFVAHSSLFSLKCINHLIVCQVFFSLRRFFHV